MKLKVPTRAHAKLKGLGPEVMAEIDKRLLAGEIARSVAAWLQVDLGLLKQEKPQTLKKMLERYRETELRDRTMQKIAGAQKGEAIKTVNNRLNAMDELEAMCRIQHGRLKKLLTGEEALPAGIINKSIGPEMKLWKEMMVDLGRLQLETGILARASKTFTGTVTTDDGETRTFEWTVEQEAMFNEILGVSASDDNGD